MNALLFWHLEHSLSAISERDAPKPTRKPASWHPPNGMRSTRPPRGDGSQPPRGSVRAMARRAAERSDDLPRMAASRVVEVDLELRAHRLAEERLPRQRIAV